MNIMGKSPLGQKTGRPVNRTAAGRAHMARVAELPCVCCGAHPVEVHHCRSLGQLRDDFRTIPLCFWHHRGPDGYHASKSTWEKTYGYDTDYLPAIADMLADEFNSPWSAECS